MKIVIIGGTGLIGSKVVEKLKHKGHEAIAAAPNRGVDTITSEGLADALASSRRGRGQLARCSSRWQRLRSPRRPSPNR